MIRYALSAAVLTVVVAVAAAFSLSGDASAREKGANIWDDRTQKWVKQKVVYRKRAPAAKYRRRSVRIKTNEKPGTIIVDTDKKFLFYVSGKNKAIRYGICVGREGVEWQGVVNLARKAKWPSWTPPKEMVEREWRENRRKVGYMPGGPKNPLGARALYLHSKRGGDTGYRIHGTNEPWSIGLSMSSGCIRMLNKDVEHLYERAKTGSKVIVIGPSGKNRKKYYSSAGLFASLLNR